MHQAAKEPEKPLLASEALREEVAPLEPGRREARAWLLGIAVVYGLLGFAFKAGIGVPDARIDASTISYSAAGAVAAVAILPFPYALRAGVALVLGVAVMTLGLRGAGPLAGLAVDGGLFRDLTRLVAVSALPAALIFRARYRAYGPARGILALALGLALPFVVVAALPILDPSGPVVSRAGAAVSVAVVFCSLFGFMGAGTTGAGSVWAGLVLLVLPSELALRELTPLAGPDTGVLTYPATSVALVAAATLAALGIYQLLAAALAGDARRRSGVKPASPSKA